MAQLGDLVRAKALVRSAGLAFGPKEAVPARCIVAEVEIALVSVLRCSGTKSKDSVRRASLLCQCFLWVTGRKVTRG
jgi:hypothetical protein